jgi:hypothetical protein
MGTKLIWSRARLGLQIPNSCEENYRLGSSEEGPAPEVSTLVVRFCGVRWASGGEGEGTENGNGMTIYWEGGYKGGVGQEHWSVEDFRGAVSQSVRASVGGPRRWSRFAGPLPGSDMAARRPKRRVVRVSRKTRGSGATTGRGLWGGGGGDRRVKVALLSFCLVGRVCCRSRPPFGVPVRKWLVSHSFFTEGGSWCWWSWGILFLLGLCK